MEKNRSNKKPAEIEIVGHKRLLRVLITPAQDEFLRSLKVHAATTEAEVVRAALNRMMHDQYGIQVPV